MSCRTSSFLVAAMTLALVPANLFAETPKPKTKPAAPVIRVSKKTTYVLGPLRKDGTVDFAAALNARARKGVTPEKNAAVLIAQVVSRGELSPEFQKVLYEKLGIPKTVKPQQRLLSPWEFAERTAGKKHDAYAEALLKQQDESRQRIWSRKEMPELAAWLKHNEQPLAVVRKAVQRRQWFNPIIHLGDSTESRMLISTLLPIAQSSRDFGRLLAANATLAVQEGRNQDAMDDLLACHRLARQIGKGLFLIDLLVGDAIEAMACEADVAVLRSGKLTAKELQRFQDTLAKLPPMPGCAEKVQLTERLVILDAVVNLQRDAPGAIRAAFGVESDTWYGPLALRAFALFVDWNRVLQRVNAEFDRIQTAVNTEPYSKRKAALNAYREHLGKTRDYLGKILQSLAKERIPRELMIIRWYGVDREAATRPAESVVVNFLMPAFTQLRIAEDRVQTKLRLVRIAVALERHRKAHGRFPARLADLRPRFLKELPADLFTEKPFHYKPAKVGYLLYSVGQNMKDDGGKPLDSSSDADDIAVRVKLMK